MHGRTNRWPSLTQVACAVLFAFFNWPLADGHSEETRFDRVVVDNNQPRPEDVVLGRPPRGGHFRMVAPLGGVEIGKAPLGP